ncbi:MAG TPA: hypothetical protein VLE91_04115 [Candidatus Saccharimonadales bacterium]|nr:hypothetical protein [Candidatus Saccharimonadales bacterium]
MQKTAFHRSKFEVILASIAVLLLLFTDQTLVFSSAPAKHNYAFDFNGVNYAAFGDFIQKNGAEFSYNLLKDNFKNNDFLAHNYAHVVGLSVFEQKGSEGMKICDAAFNYGCFHGFIEGILRKDGVGAMSGIEKACFDLGSINAASCLHGIGHGVMAISYDLPKALETCDSLGDFSREWCWDGVFMERNVGSMQLQSDRFVLTGNNLMKPCEDLDLKYQDKCWRNQTYAWYSFFGGDVKKVASQCSLISQQFYQTCVRNLGMQTVAIYGSAQKSVDLCSRIVKTNFRDLCFLGTLDELMFEGRDVQNAASICDFVSTKDECTEEYVQQESNYRERFAKK